MFIGCSYQTTPLAPFAARQREGPVACRVIGEGWRFSRACMRRLELPLRTALSRESFSLPLEDAALHVGHLIALRA